MECTDPNISSPNPALSNNSGTPNDQITQAQAHNPSRGSVGPAKIFPHGQQNRQHLKRSPPQAYPPSEPTGCERFIPGSIFYSQNYQKLRGWRMGVLLNAGLVTVVLLINITVTAWAYFSYSTSSGIGTFYTGSCERVRQMNLWIHLAINLLSTAMLSGSNYTQQCLSSPTRAEVNGEHSQQLWLDVGVPSVRNLWSISRFRFILWALLALSSVPLHLLFNSAVFTTIATFAFTSRVVAEDFFSPDIFPNEHPDIFSNKPDDFGLTLKEVQSWDTKKPAQCLSDYRPNMITKFREVYIVVSGNTTNRSDPIIDWYYSQTEMRSNVRNCTSGDFQVLAYSCSVETAINRLTQGIPWTAHGREVKGCRVEPMKENCKLQFSAYIMTVIILCNILKVISMLSAGFQELGSPLLVTIGDAIDSFIREPDKGTKGICNAEKDFILNTWMVSGESGSAALVWKRHRWRESVSRARRCACAGLCLAAVGVAAVLLRIGLHNDGTYMYTDIKAIWNRGIGELNPNSIVSIGSNTSRPIISASILANLPQPILSFLYLMYNAVFTSMLVGREWSHYAIERRAVRVTKPCGLQRSTYWLGLPYRYAIPFLGLSGLLHWLASQSLFLARIEIYARGAQGPAWVISTAGYSCGAIICTLALAVLALVFAEAIGWRRYPGNMPVVGSCSTAISAACHPPEGVDRVKLAVGKLQLRGVEDTEGMGRLVFLATEDPLEPENGKLHSWRRNWIPGWSYHYGTAHTV